MRTDSVERSSDCDRDARIQVNARCSFRKYTLELYERPSAPLELKIRMLRAEVFETMLYGYVTEPARVPLHHAEPSPPQLPDSLHRLNNHTDRPISYPDTLIKTESESIEATLCRRRILFAGFVACMEDTRLPKCVMFEKLVGSAGCVGGQEKEWMGCFLDNLRAFGINADQWTTAQLRTRGNGAGRRNKGRNVLGEMALQKKPGLDFGMQ